MGTEIDWSLWPMPVWVLSSERTQSRPSGQRCKDCRLWEPPFGRCHHSYVSSRREDRLPVTMPDDWCSEWREIR